MICTAAQLLSGRGQLLGGGERGSGGEHEHKCKLKELVMGQKTDI